MLVMAMSICGFDHLSSRFLPVAGVRTKFMTRGVQLGSAGAGFLGGLLFWLGSPLWSEPVFRMGFGFLILTSLCTVSVVQDHIFVGLSASKWIPITKGLMAIGRLMFLLAAPVLVGVSGSGAILWAWGATFLVFNAVSWLIADRIANAQAEFSLESPRVTVSEYTNFAMANHLGAVLTMLPTLAFPALVLNFLGDDASAYFYLSWMIGSLLLFSISNVAIALVAQAAEDEHELGQLVRTAFRFTSMIIVPGVLVLLFAADHLLALVGPGYQTAANCLRLLAVACLIFPINAFYIASMRVQRQLLPILIHGGISGGVAFGSAVVLGQSMGLTGFGLAFLGGQIAGAIMISIALVGPVVAARINRTA